MGSAKDAHTIEVLLSLAGWGVVLLAAIWGVLSVLSYWNRKAYNLTPAESGGAGAADPGFLSVDQEKREAALKGGEAFDAKIAARDAAEAAAAQPAESQTKATSWARLGATAFAIIMLLTAAVGALARVELYDATVRQLTSMERLAEIATNYWAGLLVALGIILVQIYFFINRVRED